MAYHWDLVGKGLQGIHDVFHVSLLKPYQNNGFDVDMPPVELEGEQEYEISCITGHRVSRGEQYFLVSLAGYDAYEDLWMSIP